MASNANDPVARAARAASNRRLKAKLSQNQWEYGPPGEKRHFERSTPAAEISATATKLMNSEGGFTGGGGGLSKADMQEMVLQFKCVCCGRAR